MVTRITQIEELEEARHILLTGSIDGLESEIRESQAGLTKTEASILAQERDINILEEELTGMKKAPLTGSIVRAKDWGDRVWPYLLISMLGMKLARKPMLALR